MIFIILLCPPAEEPDEIIGVEEFARLSGYSEATIRNRKAGTRRVPLARRKPLGWWRSQVVEFLTPRRADGPAQFAARLVDKRSRGRCSKR